MADIIWAMTIWPFWTAARPSAVPTAMAAPLGGVMVAVKLVTPNMPVLEMANPPPDSSSGRGVDMLPDNGHGLVTEEGRPAGDQLVEHGSQGIEVGLRRHRPAHRLRQRHVGDCSHHHAFLRETRTVLDYSEPEVADLGDAIAGKPHVNRLQVSVDDAALVGELEACGPLCGVRGYILALLVPLTHDLSLLARPPSTLARS